MLQTFAVTVPPGVGPGQQFQASLDGQLTKRTAQLGRQQHGWADECDGAMLLLRHARLLREMRLPIGRLFLAAEPSFAAFYHRAYPSKLRFRCQSCYHLFGVDLSQVEEV